MIFFPGNLYVDGIKRQRRAAGGGSMRRSRQGEGQAYRKGPQEHEATGPAWKAWQAWAAMPELVLKVFTDSC